MKNALIIYSDHITSRLNYILDVLLVDLLGIPYLLTSNIREFRHSDLLRLNYSALHEEKALQIIPSGLLFETGTRQLNVGFEKWGNQPVLFFNSDKNEIPFDIFSASFYLLTRYEEYLPFQPDEHGRFNSELSTAGKHGFLEEPVVQQWAFILLRVLQQYSPGLTLKKHMFSLEPTIDVDVAFAFRYRNLSRLLLASGRDFLTFRWNYFIYRLLVLLKSRQDPYDTYDYIDLIHKKYSLPICLFYLIGDYSNYDRNLPPDSPAVQYLLKHLNEKFILGVHPSYRASDHFEELKREISRIAQITGNKITASRQHFLRLTFPKSYQWLIQLGITDDYSMGYHDKPGFRAGIAAPYRFYDLHKETKTTLTVHPFVFMERVLKDRLQLDPDMALLKIQDLMKKVKGVNGTFGTLWHNDSLSDFGEWKRWRYVYEVMLSMAHTMNRKQKNKGQLVRE